MLQDQSLQTDFGMARQVPATTGTGCLETLSLLLGDLSWPVTSLPNSPWEPQGVTLPRPIGSLSFQKNHSSYGLPFPSNPWQENCKEQGSMGRSDSYIPVSCLLARQLFTWTKARRCYGVSSHGLRLNLKLQKLPLAFFMKYWNWARSSNRVLKLFKSAG